MRYRAYSCLQDKSFSAQLLKTSLLSRMSDLMTACSPTCRGGGARCRNPCPFNTRFLPVASTAQTIDLTSRASPHGSSPTYTEPSGWASRLGQDDGSGREETAAKGTGEEETIEAAVDITSQVVTGRHQRTRNQVDGRAEVIVRQRRAEAGINSFCSATSCLHA